MTEVSADHSDLNPTNDHTHHWIIGPQAGPSSEGICKSCGATRDFTNAYSRTYRSHIYMRRGARPRRDETA